MKWKWTGWGLAALLTLPVARAVDVNIRVEGSVVARMCTISKPIIPVDFGDLNLFELQAPGAASAWHDFTLFMTLCPEGLSGILTRASGVADGDAYYKNQGTAQNIQLELQDGQGFPMSNGKSMRSAIDKGTLMATIPLRVRAISVKGGATQGSIQSVITLAFTSD